MRKRAVFQWVARECIRRVRSQDYNFAREIESRPAGSQAQR